MENKPSFLGAIGLFWKNIFNYKDLAQRREYWLVFLFQTIVIVIALVAAYLAYETRALPTLIISGILTAYIILSVLPWISLTVRRLHDTGKSGWWTLLMGILGIGLVILIAMCTVSSHSDARSFGPSFNNAVCVYGPPEWFEPDVNENVDVYGPPEWDDPSENENAPMYGPAIPDEETDEEDADAKSTDKGDTKTSVSAEKEFEPEENIQVAVYGPPEWFIGEEPKLND